jgi:hypothetical protein
VRPSRSHSATSLPVAGRPPGLLPPSVPAADFVTEEGAS